MPDTRPWLTLSAITHSDGIVITDSDEEIRQGGQKRGEADREGTTSESTVAPACGT
jgi:hypothetical protein